MEFLSNFVKVLRLALAPYKSKTPSLIKNKLLIWLFGVRKISFLRRKFKFEAKKIPLHKTPFFDIPSEFFKNNFFPKTGLSNLSKARL